MMLSRRQTSVWKTSGVRWARGSGTLPLRELFGLERPATRAIPPIPSPVVGHRRGLEGMPTDSGPGIQASAKRGIGYVGSLFDGNIPTSRLAERRPGPDH